MCDVVVVVEECLQQCGKVQLRTVVKTSSPSLQQQNSIAWLGTQHQQQRSRMYARAPRLLHSQLLPLEFAARRPGALRAPKSVETKASLTGRSGSGQKKIVEKLFEANQKRSVEKLCQKLFSDPSQWWDHRSTVLSYCPDLAYLASLIVQSGWHVKYGQGQKALALYQQMQLEGVEPDPVIFMGVLNVCGIVAALEVGRVFNKISTRDVVAWNAMHGLAKEALEHFHRMCEEVLESDPGNSLGSMPLSNINIAAGRWDLGASV
ncbi:unnamed protein product [Sphagnum balticum]